MCSNSLCLSVRLADANVVQGASVAQVSEAEVCVLAFMC